MFYNRKLNNHISCIERTVKIAYQEHNSTFDRLLAKDISFKMRGRNLHKLIIKIFKFKISLALEIINEVFNIVEWSYLFRNGLRFKFQIICAARHGTVTFLARGYAVIYLVN